MRLILALAAAGAIAACSQPPSDTEPHPETGQVSTDTMQTTRTPAGTVEEPGGAGTPEDSTHMRPDSLQ